ncbi:MAG: sensor histidine kinase [Candidatus Binatia bacterium]
MSDKKRTLITLQWVVVIVTSYFVLFSKGEVTTDPWVFLLVLLFLTSVFVLYRLPEGAFHHRFLAHTLVLVDTILISGGILLNRESPWDLFLVFFFGLFIAGVGENLIQIVVGCLILSIISVILSSLPGDIASPLESDLLIRVPFIFGVSLLYGYLAEQVKREKRRAEKAEEAEKLRRQLVSALAHDIKNPLGIIMGYAETAAARLEGRPEDNEQSEALQRIHYNAQRIVKLVMGFLDVSRVEAGKVEVAQQPLQLNRLIREVGQQQMGDLRRKDISLSVDLDEGLPEIMGDEPQLDRVLWNLLGNAVKFTPTGGTITLTSRVDNGQVCIIVKDSGVGIPEIELPHLFSEFRPLRSTARNEGTGLGLFIVKTIVEAHGGTVDAESKAGQGSTFTVRFPIRP